MTKQRVREIAKIAAASILSIGLFSAALMGINSWAFARATNATLSFPLPEEDLEIHESLPQEDFTASELTISASPWQVYHEVSASAMSMEDAAQIGAQYILDVFGTCIDGMHIQLFFSAWPSSSRTHWHGTVYPSEAAMLEEMARQEAINEALTRDINADVSAYTQINILTAPNYNFSIDAVTGMRIDISYRNLRGVPTLDRRDHDAAMSWRQTIVDSGWFDMDIYEQMNFVGLSSERLEAYAQTVKDLAQRHFNNSTVADVQLTFLNLGSSADHTAVVLDGLSFTATDDTGREAHIQLPSESANFHTWISIMTQHNDFIPDFHFDAPAGGRG